MNDFLIDFDATLVTKIDILSTIKIQLIDIQQADYYYTISQITSTQFKVNFQVMKTIPATTIEVEVPCPTRSGYVFASNITKKATTKKILFGSDELLSLIHI